RSALPELPPATSRADYMAPRDDREAAIAAAFADVLGMVEVGVHNDFFALGGHSLSGALAVARISAELGRPVPLAWLLTGPSVAALAERIEAGGDSEPRAQRHAGQTTF